MLDREMDAACVWDPDQGRYIMISGLRTRLEHWRKNPKSWHCRHLCGHGMSNFRCDDFMHVYAGTQPMNVEHFRLHLKLKYCLEGSNPQDADIINTMLEVWENRHFVLIIWP